MGVVGSSPIAPTKQNPLCWAVWKGSPKGGPFFVVCDLQNFCKTPLKTLNRRLPPSTRSSFPRAPPDSASSSFRPHAPSVPECTPVEISAVRTAVGSTTTTTCAAPVCFWSWWMRGAWQWQANSYGKIIVTNEASRQADLAKIANAGAAQARQAIEQQQAAEQALQSYVSNACGMR